MSDSKISNSICSQTAHLWDAAEQIHGPWMLGHRTVSGLRTLDPQSAAQGPAYTIRMARSNEASLDNHRAFLEAYDRAPAGSMVVVQIVDNIASALGDIVGHRLSEIGVAGVVTDGYIRDIEGIREHDLKVWFRDTLMAGLSTRELCVETGVAVTVNGLVVRPGDHVAADVDGVFIVPAGEMDDLNRRGLEIVDRAEKRHAELAAGKTLVETCARLKAAGAVG